MNKRTRLGLIIGVVILIGGGLFGSYWAIAHRKHNNAVSLTARIPTAITDKVSFQIYVPSDTSIWDIDTPRSTYDQQNGVLTLYVTHNSDQIIVTQQATPQVFSDVPQQYSKMLSSMNQYAELQTSFGAIGLTHPKELNGGQAAVINKTGTLLFAKPTRDLSEDEWKNFFSNLQIFKS